MGEPPPRAPSLRAPAPARWVVVACAGVGAMSLLVPAGAARVTDARAAAAASPSSAGSAGGPSASIPACPAGTLPDGPVCVSVAPDSSEAPLLVPTKNAHRERQGRWTEYEQIARLPDRPADYDLYRYPFSSTRVSGHAVASGYDLDRPDREQRRGARLSHVGHGGVDLLGTRGTPVTLVALEHQQGPSDVLFAGPLFGTTVVTHHTVREAGMLRDYIVLYGHLDRIGTLASAGAELQDGAEIGTVGDSGSPGIIHLHLEVRRVREGVDLRKIPAGPALIAETVSVVCDPRNVLPLRNEK